MSKFQRAYQKSVDYALAVLFKFWFWLGVQLEVTITVPEPAPWVITQYHDTPETQSLLADLVAENDQLRAEAVKYANLIANGQTGEDRPNRKKLTSEEVNSIRSLKRSGYSQADIAEIYDVNPATVSRIVRGQYHKKLVSA